MILEGLSSLIAIIVGIVAVIQLVGNAELILSTLSLTFGIMALIWIIKARGRLSKGSSLRSLATNFMSTLIFILCFSFWGIAVNMLSLKDIYGDIISFPQYMLLSLAYIAFVGAAYKMMKMGEEFGFNVESKKIERLIKNKKKK
ncbi:MAG: hypothetical protein QME12_02840 [Nanoarchaeota archaeon]|nr:hypothetical protein [Nanoarchaeota archaeon]